MSSSVSPASRKALFCSSRRNSSNFFIRELSTSLSLSSNSPLNFLSRCAFFSASARAFSSNLRLSSLSAMSRSFFAIISAIIEAINPYIPAWSSLVGSHGRAAVAAPGPPNCPLTSIPDVPGVAPGSSGGGSVSFLYS